jgi:putative hydrolase of the HAD superfamily
MIKNMIPITCVFLDIGGVMLTDGWDHRARKRAAMNFKIDFPDSENRHHLVFETYEQGNMTMEEYLDLVIFYRQRSFTRSQFQRFMFAQSKPHLQMIELLRKLKSRYGLKIVAVNNEGRELNEFRIRKFKLHEFVDSYISSCFVHVRKPDADIFRFALDIAQVEARHVVYMEDTPVFIRIAEGLGIRSILHTDYKSTSEKLALLGLEM